MNYHLNNTNNICLTVQEAADLAARKLEERHKKFSFYMPPGVALPHNFVGLILNTHPQLIPCLTQISYTCSGFTWDVRAEYTGVDPKQVQKVNTCEEFKSALCQAAKIHSSRFYAVFPREMKAEIDQITHQSVQQPRLLNCYVQCLEPSYKQMEGCLYLGYKLKLHYTCSQAEHFRRDKLLHEELQNVCKILRSKPADNRGLVLEAGQYFADKVSYSAAKPTDYTAYGALVEKQAACMGMALAFQMVASELGVPTRYVTGQRNGEGHAWNQVFLGGFWLNIDPTLCVCQHTVNFYRTIQDFGDNRTANMACL